MNECKAASYESDISCHVTLFNAPNTHTHTHTRTHTHRFYLYMSMNANANECTESAVESSYDNLKNVQLHSSLIDGAQRSSVLAGNSLHTIYERRVEFHLFFQACRQCSWSYLHFSENMQPCSLHIPITHTCRHSNNSFHNSSFLFRRTISTAAATCRKLDSNPPLQSALPT